jgi:hypothetical protein
MNLEEQILEVVRRSKENATKIVMDTANNTYYLCYAFKDGIATTDALWKIRKFVLTGSTWDDLLYVDNKYDKKIDTGAGVLATLQSYTTNWINYRRY